MQSFRIMLLKYPHLRFGLIGPKSTIKGWQNQFWVPLNIKAFGNPGERILPVFRDSSPIITMQYQLTSTKIFPIKEATIYKATGFTVRRYVENPPREAFISSENLLLKRPVTAFPWRR